MTDFELKNLLANNKYQEFFSQVEKILQEKKSKTLYNTFITLRSQYQSVTQKEHLGIELQENIEVEFARLRKKCLEFTDQLFSPLTTTRKNKWKVILPYILALLILVLLFGWGSSPAVNGVKMDLTVETESISFETDFSKTNLGSFDLVGSKAIDADFLSFYPLREFSLFSLEEENPYYFTSKGPQSLSNLSIQDKTPITIQRESHNLLISIKQKNLFGTVTSNSKLEISIEDEDYELLTDTSALEYFTFSTQEGRSALSIRPLQTSDDLEWYRIPTTPEFQFINANGTESKSAILGGNLSVNGNIIDTFSKQNELKLDLIEVSQFDITSYTEYGLVIKIEALGRYVYLNKQNILPTKSKIEVLTNNANATLFWQMVIGFLGLVSLFQSIRKGFK